MGYAWSIEISQIEMYFSERSFPFEKRKDRDGPVRVDLSGVCWGLRKVEIYENWIGGYIVSYDTDLEVMIKENNLMLKLICKQLKISTHSQRTKLRGEAMLDKVDQLTRAGYSLKEISAELEISVPTVSSYRRMIKKRNTVEVEKTNDYEIGSDEDQAALDAMLDFPIEFDDNID